MTTDLVAEAVAERKLRADYYQTARLYAAGRQQLRFASTDFDQKYAQQLAGLRLNVCEAVISAFSDKLDIATWGDNNGEAELGLSRILSMVHREMIRCGDSYVMVWRNLAGEPVPRYGRADEFVPTVDSDDPSRLSQAVRLWIDPHRYARAMVIDAEGADRYRSLDPIPKGAVELPESSRAWVEMDDDDGPRVTHDFGAVPVGWFRRNADDTDAYGSSVLDDVIPIQDGINKALADLLVLSESYSRPFWYLLNFRPQNASNPAMAAQEWAQAAQALPTMRNDRFNPDRQKIFTHDGPGPFGELTPADLSRLTTLLQELKVHAAGVVGIPSFYFTQNSGDVPSGESLRVLSSRLTSGVRSLQRETGPVWRGIGQLLGIDIDIKWADPMPESEDVKLANAETKRRLGVPLVQIFKDLGYTNPEEMARQAMIEQQQRSQMAAQSFAEGNLFLGS